VLQYSNYINGYDVLNLTKLDVLDGLDEIKIAVKYKIGDAVLEGFPGAFSLVIYYLLTSSTALSFCRSVVLSFCRSVVPASSPVFSSIFWLLLILAWLDKRLTVNLISLSPYLYLADLDLLSRVTVEYVTFPGWKSDITKATTFEELPEKCRQYVEYIEQFLGVKIGWIGVGPSRDSMITR
jgi:adenylosuccinate synthase